MQISGNKFICTKAESEAIMEQALLKIGDDVDLCVVSYADLVQNIIYPGSFIEVRDDE